MSSALGGSGPNHHDLHHTESRREEPEQGGCCLISSINSVHGTRITPVVLSGRGGDDFAPRGHGYLETVLAVIAGGG